MARIYARRHWNKTPFQLQRGKEYAFKATGRWWDFSHPCDARGYALARLRRFESCKRCRAARWFSLIGSISRRPDSRIDIGRLIATQATYKAAASGILYCFANDAPFMYWNNFGSIDLQMRAVEAEE